MNTSKFALLVLLCSLLPNGETPATESSSEISWTTRRADAFAEASRSERPVLVDVWAVWCDPCKVMDETTYRDEKVVRAMAGFVPLKLDADSETIFVERYGLASYPTTLFLDEKGREIARVTGLSDANGLLRIMERVGGGYTAYREELARPDDPAALTAAAEYLAGVQNPDAALPLLRKALKLAQGDGPDATEALELTIAETLLAAGRLGAAAKALERLSDAASEPEHRGRALFGLVRAERKRGRERRAEQVLVRLRQEYPGLAEGLAD